MKPAPPAASPWSATPFRLMQPQHGLDIPADWLSPGLVVGPPPKEESHQLHMNLLEALDAPDERQNAVRSAITITPSSALLPPCVALRLDVPHCTVPSYVPSYLLTAGSAVIKDMSEMESLRADLIRRARSERHGQVEASTADVEMANGYSNTQQTSETQQHTSRFPLGRPLMPRIFGRQQDSRSTGETLMTGVESPKSPDFNSRGPALPPNLALSVTKNVHNSEMNIMLILVILFGTIFFCHGLIRLCILVVRGDREDASCARLPKTRGPHGYAMPPQPIPVVLARDEEAAGVESEASKSMPPAYGLWRESVRVDPNRLFWQRNEAADQFPIRPETRSGPRPPSYISEDGISYVVEAVPRSTAPTTDVPLPPHPSEAGRAAQAQSP
ncbi:hypothetical protein G7046_g900 [Stylonectria norvegica]|nr:hypothetical protein G7046_g900 [Stylonectria norvegica]